MPYMPIFGTVIRYVTATFNSNGGTPTYPTARVRRNTALNSPGTPTRSGFVFSGWSPSLPATILVNTTYTAQWTASTPTTSTPTVTFTSCFNGVLQWSVKNNDASSVTMVLSGVLSGTQTVAAGATITGSLSGLSGNVTGSARATASGKNQSALGSASYNMNFCPIG